MLSQLGKLLEDVGVTLGFPIQYRVAVSGFAFAQTAGATTPDEDNLFSLPDNPEAVDIYTFPDDTFSESVTLIGLKQTPCEGACPVYELVMNNDGSVVYKGERFVEKEGTFTGQVNAQNYNHLAEYIVTNDLKSLADEYRFGATDLPGTYVAFVQDGEKKVIYDYGNVGPTNLWVLQQLIDSMLSNVVWDE